MNVRRSDREQDQRDQSGEHVSPLLMAETLRPGKSQANPTPVHPEEKVSVFWRIFGGTILSIGALVVITAYQSITSSINDLRTSVTALHEVKGDFLKKDEHAASRTRTWDRIQEVQKEAAALAAPMGQLKDRLALLEEQNKSHAAERKEVQQVQQTLAALTEKSALRDQQLKQIEDERKDLLKEIQSLRERLARLEASKEPKPAKAPMPPPDDAPKE